MLASCLMLSMTSKLCWHNWRVPNGKASIQKRRNCNSKRKDDEDKENAAKLKSS